jgi:hypothetical protein
MRGKIFSAPQITIFLLSQRLSVPNVKIAVSYISSSLEFTFCEISRLERRDVSFQSPHHLPIQQKTKGRPCRMAARQTIKFQIHKPAIQCTRAEFLDVIGTKSQEFSSLLFTVTSTNRLCSPPPPSRSKSGFKLVCIVNIVYRNLKSMRTLKIMSRNLIVRS